MKQKPVIAIQSRNQIFSCVCNFFTKEVNPSKYSPTDEAETDMQLHFSDYLSESHDILREVPIPKCCDIEGCGEKTWEIDESLRISTTTGRTFFVSGELKIHGQEMKKRNFVDEAIKDIRRMRCVYTKYIDITMTFTAFITCDEKERDDVYQFAESQDGISAEKLTCPEEGYFAVVVRIDFSTTIIPQAPLYAIHWDEWLYSVRHNEKEHDYFFPIKRVRMW